MSRLPGIAFIHAPQPLPEVLPRMDIAAFVGLASCGPLHVPVAVEGPARFRDVFGETPTLGWDTRRGIFRRAFLGPAVEAFFDNGGRRCWVVRVADEEAAYRHTFTLPGVFAPHPVTGFDDPQPVRVRARAAGSWCEDLRVGTMLRRRTDAFEDDSPPHSPPLATDGLSFDILVWRGDTLVGRLDDLAFHPDHPRFWGRLPVDEELFALPSGRPQPLADPAADTLVAEAADPRFALAGPGGTATPCWPMGMATRPDPELAVAPDTVPPGTRLERDGLASYGPEIFLDPDVAGSTRRALRGEAEHKLYVRYEALRGLHSLLLVDEVSLVAVPDACHGVFRRASVRPLPLPPLPPEPEPERPCPPSDFHDCTGPELSPPELSPPELSPPELSPTPPALEWEVVDPAGDTDPNLVTVQRALLRFAAARADLVAVLHLPRGARPGDAERHLGVLTPGEDENLSYGALYAPWPAVRREEGERGADFQPPDGVVTGALARQALDRGAWTSAANAPLAGVVALGTKIDRPAWQRLADLRVNALRRDPRGFLILGAATLSAERELDVVPVRRLMILLRRLALRAGNGYVFEPNDTDFRARVHHRFERLLSGLHVRGAFAGEAATAFRVVTDESVNPRTSVDLGRFIVELQVAPSRPLSFLTVRLVQTGPQELSLTEV